MAKVLTESEVATIGGTSTSYGNRCCTKARAEELGCIVTEPSNAADNQLITGVKAGSSITFNNTGSTYTIGFQYKAYYDGAYHEIEYTSISPLSSVTITLQTDGDWTLYFANAYTVSISSGERESSTITNSVSGSGSGSITTITYGSTMIFCIWKG